MRKRRNPGNVKTMNTGECLMVQPGRHHKTVRCNHPQRTLQIRSAGVVIVKRRFPVLTQASGGGQITGSERETGLTVRNCTDNLFSFTKEGTVKKQPAFS